LNGAAGSSRPSGSPWYGLATAIVLVCCGPIGLIALWLGPWSVRNKILITLVWLLLFGPASFYYVSHGYYGTPQPSPTPQ
jgi:hypothetical protein